MKLINVGKKRNNYDSPEKSTKDKIYYPDLSIEKNIGDFEIGDEVDLALKAVVIGEREDEYGYRISFNVVKVGVKDMTAKDVIDKAAASMLS